MILHESELAGVASFHSSGRPQPPSRRLPERDDLPHLFFASIFYNASILKVVCACLRRFQPRRTTSDRLYAKEFGFLCAWFLFLWTNNKLLLIDIICTSSHHNGYMDFFFLVYVWIQLVAPFCLHHSGALWVPSINSIASGQSPNILLTHSHLNINCYRQFWISRLT